MPAVSATAMMFLRPSSIQERIAKRYSAGGDTAYLRGTLPGVNTPAPNLACDARPQNGLKAQKARCHKDIGPFFWFFVKLSGWWLVV